MELFPLFLKSLYTVSIMYSDMAYTKRQIFNLNKTMLAFFFLKINNNLFLFHLHNYHILLSYKTNATT